MFELRQLVTVVCIIFGRIGNFEMIFNEMDNANLEVLYEFLIIRANK